MAIGWLFYLASAVKTCELLICVTVLYCYYKIKILKKPPGRLIFIQLILLLIIETLQCVFALRINLDQSETQIDELDWVTFSLVYLAFWVCYLYETCLNFELYIRIKNSPMGQNYQKREKIYHLICLSITVLSAIVTYPIYQHSSSYSISLFSGTIHLKFYSPLHYIVLGKILLESIFIFSCLYFYRKIRNPVKASRFKYNILYLCLFQMVVVFNMIASMLIDVRKRANQSKVALILVLFIMLLKISLYIVRLTEPGVRKYIKDSLRYIKLKFKSKFTRMRRRALSASIVLYDIAIPSLNSINLFEELKEEIIECQLIAINIISLNNYTEEDLNEDPGDIYDRIRAHDLELLSDNHLVQKYSDFYCEYKIYQHSSFRQIVNYDGLEANDIANSFAVRENMEGIMKYISEDGSELMLNFVTFDNRFILRSLRRREQQLFLRDKLQGYIKRVMNDSLLQHIYGIFKLIIKGKIYRLMIMENNPFKYLHRNKISINSQVFEQEERVPDNLLDGLFALDDGEKDKFERVLNQDIEYIRSSKMRKCRIMIDILDKPGVNEGKELFKGVYQNEMRYLAVTISDVSYSSKKSEYKDIWRSSIELSVNTKNLNAIESKIRKYIQ